MNPITFDSSVPADLRPIITSWEQTLSEQYPDQSAELEARASATPHGETWAITLRLKDRYVRNAVAVEVLPDASKLKLSQIAHHAFRELAKANIATCGVGTTSQPPVMIIEG